MSKSIRSFTSDILTELRSQDIDSWISPQSIFSKAVSITQNFLKKDNSSNLMIANQVEGWSNLPAIEMEEVPLVSCGLDIYICNRVMKSVKKLPDFYTSKVAPLIREVASADYSKTYNYIKSFSEWKNTQKQEFISKRYFLIINGYLYIPVGKKDIDGSPEVVTLTGYCPYLNQVDEFNNGAVCKKIADYDFVCPSYLQDDVKKEIINQYRSAYLQVVPDTYPNLSQIDKTNNKNQ